MSVQAKNKKANDMLRADMVNEEQLLRQLIALIDKLHGLEFGSDSKVCAAIFSRAAQARALAVEG